MVFFSGWPPSLVLPEAFRSGPWPVVTIFLLAGCLSFAWVEQTLHGSLHRSGSPVLCMPLPAIFGVIALHNALDGWNMGIGAMLRSSAAGTKRNLLVAASAEGITLMGAIMERALISEMGQRWTIWFLAAAGGSFLFLAFHTLAEAKRGTNLNQTLSFGALGFGVVGTAALFRP